MPEQTREWIAEQIKATWADGGIGAEQTADAILAHLREQVAQTENPRDTFWLIRVRVIQSVLKLLGGKE